MPLTAIPKVSCITVFYNRGDLLDRSVDSLIDQTLQDLEIIVIDDGSTDETMTKLKCKSDPRLKTVFQANIGFTASMNRAIRASKGRYIAVHGAGDISTPIDWPFKHLTLTPIQRSAPWAVADQIMDG
ncbi:glycosyltransferase family 2 protein [Sphingomonas sp. 22R3R2A-7]|uniref:glycosyltransferase family 2 protein n=1 Tax=Sphingomonas sp. 22R3R2A-7 TaxID=3050230 RepID=UPI003FA68A11